MKYRKCQPRDHWAAPRHKLFGNQLARLIVSDMTCVNLDEFTFAKPLLLARHWQEPDIPQPAADSATPVCQVHLCEYLTGRIRNQ